MDALESLLNRLSSGENAIRQAAEQELQSHWLQPQQSESFLLGLGHWTRQHPDPQFRSFAAILLRRVGLRGSGLEATDESPCLLAQLSAESQSKLQDQLLQSFLQEPVMSVRRKVTDTISEWALLLREDDDMHQRSEFSWPALIQALQHGAQSDRSEYRQSAMWLLASVPQILWPAVDMQLQPQAFQGWWEQMQTWKTILLACLSVQPSTTMDSPLILATIKAVVSILLCDEWGSGDKLKWRNTWSNDFMVNMANCLLLWAQEQTRDEESLSEALTSFIELAEIWPRILKDLMKTMVPFLVSIVQTVDLEDRSRQTALELLVTLAETAPGMCRKLENPSFCAQVVPAAMSMMTELEEDEDWYTTDKLDDSDDSDSNYIVGEQAMDRLARALGGKHILPPTFQVLPSFFGSAEWSRRYAGLMCISAIGEGCVKIMEKELGKVVDMVLPHLVRDPHPRVRYAACNAIGQMCTDFSPKLQEVYHEKIVMGLCSTMECVDQPRVQAHGAAALVNFCEQASQAAITPYLETIFARLTVLLQTQRTYLQEQAITTLATVADAAGDQFVAYYPAVIVVLLDILQTATTKEYRLLRGKAMECASLIALAVGKDHFAPHAKQLIDYMMHTQQTATDPDDPQASYLLAAWARICKVLGPDFVPYLDVVMPPLIASAQHRPDVAVLDPEDNEEDKGFNADDGWEFVKIDQQKIGIKTTALEEKCTAVEMLICYARELGAGFQKYAEPVLRLVVPLLNFYFHEGVRHAAAAVLPHLFNSMKSAGVPPEHLTSLWHQTISSLLISIHDEPDAETLVQFLIAFYESLQVMGPNSLMNATVNPLPSNASSNPLDGSVDPSAPPKIHPIVDEKIPLLAYFCRAITGQISEVSHRIQTRTAQRLDADLYDPEMEETLKSEEDMEDAVLGELSRAVHLVFKLHGSAFLPFFHQGLLPAVSGMLHAQPTASPGANNASGQFDATTAAQALAANQAKQWAVCVMDDLIEFCGPVAAWEYRSHFWDAFLQGILNVRPVGAGGSPDVRQACCYGLGVLAQGLGSSQDAVDAGKVQRVQMSEEDRLRMLHQWAALLLEALSMLLTSLSPAYRQQQQGMAAPSKDEDEDEDEAMGQQLAHENAVSAVGKLMHYVLEPLLPQQQSSNSSSTPTSPSVLVTPSQWEQVTLQWFQALPVVEDEEEAIHTYTYFLHLLCPRLPPTPPRTWTVEQMQWNPLLVEGGDRLEHTLFILLQALTRSILPMDLEEDGSANTGAPSLTLQLNQVARLLLPQCTPEQKQRLWQPLTSDQSAQLQRMGWI